jgi:NAD(P)-dependent dehydrogenase (short-subunit alcohol dehydrogenase family)
MFTATGVGSTIVRELATITGEHAQRIEGDLSQYGAELTIPDGSHRYVLAAGVLHGRAVQDLTPEQVRETLAVNLVSVVRICDTVLRRDPKARICIIGSQSGCRWSFDELYALAKGAVHRYVEQRPTRCCQQLVAVAPPIIADSGMTMRRHDYPAVLATRPHCRAVDVARVVHRLLWTPRELAPSGLVVPVPAGNVMA